jgi:hypothetical protein
VTHLIGQSRQIWRITSGIVAAAVCGGGYIAIVMYVWNRTVYPFPTGVPSLVRALLGIIMLALFFSSGVVFGIVGQLVSRSLATNVIAGAILSFGVFFSDAFLEGRLMLLALLVPTYEATAVVAGIFISGYLVRDKWQTTN